MAVGLSAWRKFHFLKMYQDCLTNHIEVYNFLALNIFYFNTTNYFKYSVVPTLVLTGLHLFVPQSNGHVGLLGHGSLQLMDNKLE